MKKTVVLLLSVILTFLAIFGGTLLFLNSKKPKVENQEVVGENVISKPEGAITAPVDGDIVDSTISTKIDKRVEIAGEVQKISGEAVCINSLEGVEVTGESGECVFGIKTADSELFYIMFSEDYEFSDDFTINFGDSVSVTGESTIYDNDVLKTIVVEEFEII